MPTQSEKAQAFQALHQRDGIFIMPNPWNVGTTRILEALGYEALATTSAGFAHAIGLRDGQTSRDQALAHAREIVDATPLPVSADLENGYGDDPETVAETIRLAAEAGLVGCSIEDSTGNPKDPIYPFDDAVRRVEAAVAAARALPFAFTLTARSENFLWGRPDLDDTLRRLEAFEAAGADVLYAPGLRNMEEIGAVAAAISNPVNVILGEESSDITAEDLNAIGIKRISLGSAFSNAALGGFLRAAREVADHGTFTFNREAAGFGEIQKLLK